MIVPALKILGDAGDRIGGYLVVFGSPAQKDLTGEYFTPETELGLDWYAQRPMLYHHGLDGELKTALIGTIDTLKVDAVGLWAEAQLDMRNRYVGAVRNLVEKGALGWSSGSLPHLVEVAADGRIKKWPIVEGSLTPTPAEPRRTNVSNLKAAIRGVNGFKTLEDLLGEAESDPERETAPSESQSQTGAKTMTIRDLVLAVFAAMGLDVPAEEQLAQIVTQVEAANSSVGGEQKADPVAQAALPEEEMMKNVEDIIPQKTINTAFIKSVMDVINKDRANAVIAEAIKANVGHGGTSRASGAQVNPPANKPTQITVGSKFDPLTAHDLALGYQMLRGRTSDEYRKAMTYKTAQLVEKGDVAANDLAVKSHFPFLKAGEVMAANSAGFGDEWVFNYYGTQLWEQIREQTPVYQKMLSYGMDEAEIPQGYEAETIPLEGADPDWYVSTGGADENASSGMVTPTSASSKFGTGQKSVTVAKLSTRLNYQQELEEDSIINIVKEANRKINVSGAEQMERILINGDTATAADTNINLIDGTPATAPSKPSYTLLNGLAKLALVTNTANAADAANTLADTIFLALLPLLGVDGKHATDPSKVLYIIDNSTYFAALNLAILKTQDVFPTATIVEGVLRRIYGIEIVRSGFFGKGNATGKVSATGGNNTKGRILLVRPDQWASRWKRRMQVFTTYYPASDTTQVVAHMRWGLAFRDNEAAAIAYNVSTTIA